MPETPRELIIQHLLRSVAFFLPKGMQFRANIFELFVQEGFKITHQVGMDKDADREIVIRAGDGATGQAALNKVQVFQRRGDIFWTVSKGEMSKVSKDLQWILSTPIFSAGASTVVGVMNVDSTERIKDDAVEGLSRGAVLIAKGLVQLIEGD